MLGLGQDLADTKQFAVLGALFEQNRCNGTKSFLQGGTGGTEAGSAPTGRSSAVSSSTFSYFLNGFGGEINFGQKAVLGRIQKNAKPLFIPISVEGYWQFELEDITVGGKKTGICKSLPGGKCQAVVDTGSSLLMAPPNLLAQLNKRLDIDDKCQKKGIPSIGFVVKEGSSSEEGSKTGVEHELTLSPDDYLDRNEKECYIAMMPVGDTGRGPLLVLGYPFLRKYYSMFDFERKRLGFVPSADIVPSQGRGKPDIKLTGIRPGL